MVEETPTLHDMGPFLEWSNRYVIRRDTRYASRLQQTLPSPAESQALELPVDRREPPLLRRVNTRPSQHVGDVPS